MAKILNIAKIVPANRYKKFVVITESNEKNDTKSI